MANKSFLDMAKSLGDKARDAAAKNSDKIEGAVDKTATFVDRQTKGRYSDKVTKAHKAARGAVGKLADDRRQGPEDQGPGTSI